MYCEKMKREKTLDYTKSNIGLTPEWELKVQKDIQSYLAESLWNVDKEDDTIHIM